MKKLSMIIMSMFLIVLMSFAVQAREVDFQHGQALTTDHGDVNMYIYAQYQNNLDKTVKNGRVSVTIADLGVKLPTQRIKVKANSESSLRTIYPVEEDLSYEDFYGEFVRISYRDENNNRRVKHYPIDLI